MTSRVVRSAVAGGLVRSAVAGWVFLVAAMVATGAVAGPDPAIPGDSRLNEQVIRVPAGTLPAVTLEVTVLHPDGTGPFPLAIMNHGADEVSAGNRGQRYRVSNAAFYFLARGYAVALPMMRGFAGSGGEIHHNGCDLAATALANASDIRSVIRYFDGDPHFDTSRVVVAGQSLGGWNTLAVGALDIPNVKGLINFNGGLRESDCHSPDGSLIEGAGRLGARTEVPSIWFYGDNDGLFPVPVWKAMYDRYVQAGGRAELVDVGAVMTDSHNFLAYPEVLPIWTARVDRFLASIGMPNTVVHAGYMPVAFPPATQFAALSDVAAVPYLNDQGRVLYRKFLTEPFPRAFVINGVGSAVAENGGFDPLGRALGLCGRQSFHCGVYAVDDRVVWKPFPPGPVERSFNVVVKADRTSRLDFTYRLNPDCSPRTFASFTVVQAPQHGRVDIARQADLPHFPPGDPFAVCNLRPVEGVGLSYTPAQGYSGGDFLAFSDDSGTLYRLEMTVRPTP